MHSVGIQGALAIKRQRKRRDEQKRAKERRYSIQSSESGDTLHSPHGSTRRKNRYGQHVNEPTMLDTKVVTSIGMLHIGVVFCVFGMFLIGAGILPDDMSTFNLFAAETWFNELVFTGAFALGLGVFLIVLNSFISKQEDTELEAYVQRQLTRSRSGHRLERDVETGGMTTRHTRKHNQAMEKEMSQSNVATPVTSELITPTTPQPPASTLMEETPSTENLLEQILEEDSFCDDRTQIVSPTSNDTKCLLGNGNGHTMHSVAITRI